MSNWKHYSMFVEEKDRCRYMSSLFQDGSWGDEISLSAYATASKCAVRVITPFKVICFGSGVPTKTLLFRSNHYDVLDQTACLKEDGIPRG